MSRTAFNIQQIAMTAQALGELTDVVVFLGGASTALLITDTGAPEARFTKDVDVIIEVGSRSEYYEIENQLRKLGFGQQMIGDDPVCRWHKQDVIVDVMPTDESILGFSNRWYPEAIATAALLQLEPSLSIRVVSAPLFICTKIEAFLHRGNDDFMMSHDIQDIVFVIDGRAEITEETRASSPECRQFIAQTFQEWLRNPYFLENLPGHLPFDSASQSRVEIVRQRFESLSLALV